MEPDVIPTAEGCPGKIVRIRSRECTAPYCYQCSRLGLPGAQIEPAFDGVQCPNLVKAQG